jgi:hypothetical protein
MKTTVFGTTCTVLAFLFSSSVSSEPAVGIGAAEMENGPCYSQTIVGPPGNFLAFLDGVHGVMYNQIGTGKYVEANSAKGTAHVTCHGQIKSGAEVEGIDVVNGQPAVGVAVATKVACEALETYGLTGACRGNNNGAIIITSEFQAGTCGWGDKETLDWSSIRTPSGKARLSCYFKD